MKCSPLMIKAVLFDLGNTLVYSHPEVIFQRILAEHGVTRSLDQVTSALIRGTAEFDIKKHEGLSAHEFYTRWNIVQLKHLGLKGPKARRLAGTIDSQWWKYAEFHLYPDVRETLLKLKRMRLKLGLITGGYEEDIEMIIPKMGLAELFDVKVGMNTTGKRKPNPKAFKYALKQLKLEPNEAIFIGDNLEADYEGAEKVGMIPVLIMRKSSPTKRLFTEVCSKVSSEIRTIETLGEIFEVLKIVSP
jgi:HAD superfamily hydrolase (TIGR01549 family)